MAHFFDFLRQPPLSAAPQILGAHLVHGELICRIVEVEAYCSADDPGSHAHRGPTPRNQVMFGRHGLSYVYLNYGIHWLLNIVVDEPGTPGALLIRAAEPLRGFPPHVSLKGPGRLGKALAINREHNALDLLHPESPLRLEPGTPPSQPPLITTRIGLAPGKGEDLPYRFIHPDRAHLASHWPPKG